jgi:hypothetical protein
MARAAGNPDKLHTFGLYDKASRTHCTSIHNASFHGSAIHENSTAQTSFHIRAFSQDARSLRDTGKASIKGNWQKSAKQTRTEEIKEPLEILKEPEVDGDRVLLLPQEVTAVTGKNRMQHKSSIFFDKGSTCSMITKDLIERLGLESLKRIIVVKSFMQTEAINTEFVVVELIREDGTVALVRAYVVDSIMEMTKV